MLAVADEGNVRTVTLDRPERRNALTPDGLTSLSGAVTEANTPVVYLHGAGDAFCAGADLGSVAAVAAGEETPETFVRRGQRVADAIEEADPIVVAGVDGSARGGGVELALACDLRVATPAATFAEPGVTFGLFGAWGGTVRLPEVVGMGNALDLSLTGRVIDATEASRMGLVSAVSDEPRRIAEDLATNDPGALRIVKERVRDRAPKATKEDREVEAFADRLAANAEELLSHRGD